MRTVTAFTVDATRGGVSRAALHLTALGVVEADIDVRFVSESIVTPGWSSYQWRLRLSVYDASSLLSTEMRASDSGRVGTT